jgi:hypothetical protein
LPSIGRNTERDRLGILYLCIRLTGSLITNTKCTYLLMVSIREPVSLIQRYSIPGPSLSVFLPTDGQYIFVFVIKEPVNLYCISVLD